MIELVKSLVKSVPTLYRPDGSPHVFIFSLPRSGSTWLLELILSQPGFRSCNEPLDLRNHFVRRHLGISDWSALHTPQSEPILRRYFQAICDGQMRFLSLNPFQGYHLVTNRIVFKMHGGEDRVNWFRDTFNGRMIYLLRHPIPVSLSHESFPRLHSFLTSPYREHFTSDQLALAQKIYATGTKLERGVLDWCFQTAVPLQNATSDWCIVSYEQLVVDPEPAITHLAHVAELPCPERMLRRLTVPSAVKKKSDQPTQRALEQGAHSNRLWLVEKWREKVTAAEEERAMEIVDRFNIDAYRLGSTLPIVRFWVGATHPTRVELGQHTLV